MQPPSHRTHLRPSLLAVAAALLGACATPPRAPATPAPASATTAAPSVVRTAAPPTTSLGGGSVDGSPESPDVRFMRHMIPHHAQALAMTALVPSRSTRADVRSIAERIQVSQRDEIAMMRRWLEAHHASSPAEAPHDASMPGMDHDAMAGMDHAPMPGMLTAAQLEALAGTTGAEFDHAFLRAMIRHHEGALTMVAELFGSIGAAQDPELFRLASDIDGDQRAEIARLRALDAATSAARPADGPK